MRVCKRERGGCVAVLIGCWDWKSILLRTRSHESILDEFKRERALCGHSFDYWDRNLLMQGVKECPNQIETEFGNFTLRRRSICFLLNITVPYNDTMSTIILLTIEQLEWRARETVVDKTIARGHRSRIGYPPLNEERVWLPLPPRLFASS